MKNVIAYLRVSTAKQNADRQHDLIKQYCKKHNHQIIDIISESESGANAERDGLRKLLALDGTDNTMIVISETSRLSREDDYLSLLEKVKFFMSIGYDVFFLDGEKEFKANTQLTLTQIITLAVEAKANADERKKTLLRTQSGKHTKILKGAFVGGKIPLGYATINNTDISNGKKSLIIDEDKRQIIETIFDCIANKGMTKVQTAKYVNISSGTIGTILHNEIYKGKYSYLNSTVDVPAIISTELFEQTQHQLKANILMKSKGVKYFNELKGIVKCPCGRNMTIQKRPDTGKFYYRCISKFDQNIEACNNTGARMDILNNLVWINTKAFLNKSDFKLKTEKYTQDLAIQISTLSYNVEQQKEQLQQLEMQAKNATLSLLKVKNDSERILIQSEFSVVVRDRDNQQDYITNLQSELSKLQLKKNDLETKVEAELLENLTQAEKAKIYVQFIETVKYYSVTRFKGLIVIIYKNGYEVILQHSSRNNKATYLLPPACTFNPVTRKVIFSTNEIDGFSIGKKVTKELDYDEVEKNFFMEEYLIQL